VIIGAVWFGILGSVEVRSAEGRVVAVGGPQSRSLLALLLLEAGRVVSAARLIDGLYGENPPGDAANALQSQVSRLRRRLRDGGDPSGLIEFHPMGYRLAVDPEDVDAHRFERLAREGRQALAAGDHPRAAALLGEALGLWRGPALADVAAASFAEAQVARLEELRLAAAEDRVEAELAVGGQGGIVAELQALVAAHPLRERLRVQLMRALDASGRRAEALAVFEDARRTLAEELGTDPSAELAAVHLAMLRADPSRTAAPPVAARGWLPAQLTSFVGREEELERVGTLLGAARLVTLTGPGGVGKTRLAVEVAARARGEVCFVDLALLGGGAQVPQAVLGALGLREAGLLPLAPGPPDPTGRLVTALTDRKLLLVLDSCEPVVDAAARLTRRLLGACPDLQVLATSREALGITGETLCPLPPLALPPPGTTLEETLGSPAVRLFADRAAAVRPDFAVDAGNAEAVWRICAALDGLPLAIELAAARLRSLTAEEVATRLDDRFRLLSRGDRTAAPRHQTLRAVVQWSWHLLDAGGQVLARRLTVFSGGATLEAAERVCGLSDTAGLLSGLVDKSLVEASAGRYRMLDTIRAFCAERLVEAGEAERLQHAHAAYFLDVAQTADEYLRRAEQVAWLDRLSAEHGNLQAALRWAVRADTGLALRLVGALSSYWYLRGLRGEVAPPAAELARVIGPAPPAGLAEEYALCVLHATSGNPHDQQLRPHWEAAAAIMAAMDRLPRQPFLTVMWVLASGPTEADLAARNHQLERWAGADRWSQALAHFSSGYLRLVSGEVVEAESAFGLALEGFRAVGDRWGTGQALDALATLAEWRADQAASLALTDEALDLAGQLSALEELAELRCRRADRLLRGGDLAAAGADYHLATEFARRAGTPATLALAHRGLGEIARRRGDLAEARRWHQTALGLCATDWQSARARSQVLTALGRVAEAEDDAGQARSWHQQSLALALGSLDLPYVPAAAEGLAGAVLLQGDGEWAALLLGVGVGLRGTGVAGDPDIARVARGAQDLIGTGAYASAFQRGAAMPREEALALLGAAAAGA
jgi:predicted ATPase/DNA-binding SARP family transcriptional activator